MNDELIKYISMMKDFNNELMELNIKYSEEIERLNNIIKRLEKDLEDKYYGRGKYAMDSDVIGIKEVLTKLQELKGE